ncbi:MAG TPA: bifunctional phosphopantothenoylcysteine decarboxylase/phosphopantothenate--cysteine ligase CoaBC [Gaiellales bacterium]|nr:bifunctional phosphopantothenoylcysteine decarboxylase/phosphopantothenate--cysteine ligase CoaBC [Gaiellales bacterium]
MILVGVCGGVAAYKTCELVRLLVRAGHEVQVVQTSESERFVGPTTFAALSRRPVLTESSGDLFPHLEASRDAALLCIAPLTATTLARIAHGEASSVLAASALAFTGPIVAAPAMNPRMWEAPETQANLALLRGRRLELVGPEEGEMAEGEFGRGRMAEPEEIAAAVLRRLDSVSGMRGLRVLVTAGGTREPIDAVRYVGNRSSGRMGAAVADEAAWRGADVTLVLAAATARPAAAMTTVRVETAAQLHDEVVARAADADVVVMAAAVSDYRPAAAIDGKRAKDGAGWTIELEPTADILQQLGAVRRDGQLLIGFAAEHGEGAVERARGKLARKGADAIVVNDVSRSDIGFDVEDNEIVIVTSNQEIVISRRPKWACAQAIWDALAPAGNRLAPSAVGH